MYHLHDVWRAGLRNYFNMLAAATTLNARALESMAKTSPLPAAYRDIAKSMLASAEMMDRVTKDYPKPAFGLNTTQINGQTVKITEQAAVEKPYCTLKRFKRDTDRNDPKVLLVAPMSGHYATLLRGTVEALLPDHDVYITDWADARDVPKTTGEFGLDDYVDYVRDFIRELGPETHVIAVCQPTIPVLAAISTLAAENDPAQPLSMTLMGGPIDTRAAPTAVTEYADKHDLNWFRDNVVMTVPPWYKGAGQSVYPGFLQLTGFMAMNPDKHMQSHIDLFHHLRQGDGESADKIKEFYDEYLAVCDLPGKFYLDTIHHVFKEQSLAKGTLSWRGQPVDPSKINKTSLLTVEGALDDIAAPGQTTAAHGLCTGLSPSKHYNYVQAGAGHYGIFNGRRWREEISPRLKAFIRKAALESGVAYDPIPNDMANKNAIKIPALWTAENDAKPLAVKGKNSNDNDRKKTGDRGARLG